jgi:hypothetical protein
MGAAVSACTRQDPNLLNVIRRTLMCVSCKASLLNEPGPRAFDHSRRHQLVGPLRKGRVRRQKLLLAVDSIGRFDPYAFGQFCPAPIGLAPALSRRITSQY